MTIILFQKPTFPYDIEITYSKPPPIMITLVPDSTCFSVAELVDVLPTIITGYSNT